MPKLFYGYSIKVVKYTKYNKSKLKENSGMIIVIILVSKQTALYSMILKLENFSK